MDIPPGPLWSVLDDDLEQVTMEMANTLAGLLPMSIRMNKRALKHGLADDIESQLRYENLTIERLRLTEDAKEAVLAFRGKRDPFFTGRRKDKIHE